METDHAEEQAAAQVQSIVAMLAALNCDYDRLDELRERRDDGNDMSHEEDQELAELEEAAGDCESRDDAEQQVDESPLSVEVRSDWEPAGVTLTATRFRIVLCTGGPHVEIEGELDEKNQPRRAWLQYQDWGTPMTQFFDVEMETLLEYAGQFYFGE